jgi:hypothetical protein
MSKQLSLFGDSPRPQPPGFVGAPYSDQDTSKAAALAIVPQISRLQETVLEFIRGQGAHGATCDEVESGLRMLHTTASPRILELRKKGLVEDSGQRRKTRSDRSAKVWTAHINEGDS